MCQRHPTQDVVPDKPGHARPIARERRFRVIQAFSIFGGIAGSTQAETPSHQAVVPNFVSFPPARAGATGLVFLLRGLLMRATAPATDRCKLGHRQKGVTLIELVITIVIVGVAVAGVIGSYSLVVGRSANTLYQSRTTAIGQAYLDEILARRFGPGAGAGGTPPASSPCNDSSGGGGSRAQYQSVNAYDGLVNQPLELVSGDFGSTYDDYRVSVSVTCDDSVGVGEDAKRIDVTVDPPQGPTMVFTAYRGNF